jgi:serine/threonine-protein kinase
MADHRYRVIRRLEAGGMAEVYLGEASSLEGFKKRVAIKRVLPHLAQNESFIAMFLDEARLSARLSHANIVSVFDISARDNTYFLIMEFVDGANLKRILESLHRRGQRFPLSEALYVCAEACRGLAYAHDLRDENGRAIGIVHRDISPPNIMLTRQGEVKVADFGLAKAGTQLSQTDPGVVKGKFSYLSPEAAAGREVDARADLFSLGIVLWEMLAGKRLFLGETDYATVKLIQQTNIPRLSPLNNQVDEAFEEILLKALTRAPEDRYQTAQEMGDALTGYLFARQLKVTNYDIANLVNSAISDDPGPAKDDTSLINRLIQEEIDESVAVKPDHLLRTSSKPAHAHHGHHEGDYEDPESWFKDDADTERMPAPPTDRPVSTPAKTGWHETGVEYEPEILDDATISARPAASPLPQAVAAAPATKTTPRAEIVRPRTQSRAGEVSISSLPAQPIALTPAAVPEARREAKSSNTGKYIVISALLAVLALALVLLRKSL